jgi:hypothetical protein
LGFSLSEPLNEVSVGVIADRAWSDRHPGKGAGVKAGDGTDECSCKDENDNQLWKDE